MYKGKYPPEEKAKAVESILRGESKQGQVAEALGLHKSTVQGWIHIYKTFGVAGLLPKEHAQVLSNRVKKQAVEAYLQGGGSLGDICKKYGIRTKSSLLCWIEDYNSHMEFRAPSTNGAHRSEIYMTKGRVTTQAERIEIVSYCMDHGKDYAAAIEKYHVSYSQIYSWVKKFRQSGIKGLEDRRGKKRIAVEMTELEQLRVENHLLKKQNKRVELENIVLKKLKDLEGRGY